MPITVIHTGSAMLVMSAVLCVLAYKRAQMHVESVGFEGEIYMDELDRDTRFMLTTGQPQFVGSMIALTFSFVLFSLHDPGFEIPNYI